MNAEGLTWVSCQFYLATVAILTLYSINVGVAHKYIGEHTPIYVMTVGSYGDPLMEDQCFQARFCKGISGLTLFGGTNVYQTNFPDRSGVEAVAITYSIHIMGF